MPRTRISIATLLIVMLAAACSRAADLQLASIFSDHMVLQRDQPLRIWGKAAAGASIEVRLGADQATAVAAADGRWLATLKPQSAGGPVELHVRSGEQDTVIKDILIGDVFLCSGQSNMQLPLREADGGSKAVADPQALAQIRLLLIPKAFAADPRDDFTGKWTTCTPEAAGSFSAVGFFFASALRESKSMSDVPIGLIDSSFGGTCVEGWIAAPTLARSYRPEDLRDSMFGIKPSNLYNAMIAPLSPANLKGVLWYQGESNAPKAQLYPSLLTSMIQDWRARFQSPELPFFIVQLPNFPGLMDGFSFVWIREAQAKVASDVPNTYLAVTIDTPDGVDLHPKAKRMVGQRLALLARQHLYGETVISAGPTFSRATADGDRIRVSFDTHGSSLTSQGHGPLGGFLVAGDDGVYYNAAASIDGDSVIVHSDEVASPRTVRYAWSAYPQADLFNSAGLPAAPFRTDTFPIQPIVEALPEPMTHRVATAKYTLAIAGDGTLSSLLVNNQQMLSNDSPGFMLVGFFGTPRQLFRARQPAPNCLEFTDGGATVRYDFGESEIAIRIRNSTGEAIPARLLLSPSVRRSGAATTTQAGSSEVAVNRDKSRLLVDAIDKIGNAGSSLELLANVPANAERTLHLRAGVE